MTPGPRWFRTHDGGPHLAVPADATAAWLTGQSSFRHSRLSPAQEAVLDDVAALGYDVVRAGLPYRATSVLAPYRPEPIASASARNAAQLVAARTSRAFRADVARHLRPLLERTRRRLLLLCGSCGVELLAGALPELRVPPGLRLAVVALGPVGRCPEPGSGAPTLVVRGARDRLSAWTCRAPADVVVAGGHLDYAADTGARAAVVRAARQHLA